MGDCAAAWIGVPPSSIPPSAAANAALMQVVGHPVAPENARPEILAIAETVIGHHETGSVLRYMEEIV